MEELWIKEFLNFKIEQMSTNSMRRKKIRKLRQQLLQYKLFENIKKLKYRNTKYKPFENHLDFLNDAENVSIDWPIEISKPKVGLVKFHHDSLGALKNAYWPKYQRYLEYNNIPHEFININESNWIDKCQKFDIIVWRTASDPSTQVNAKTKIYFLENYLKKLCHPRYKELWFYEEKVKQYYLFKINYIPSVDTFITNDKKEAIEFINTTKYPFVSKINTGASSMGVELIKNKKAAIKYVNKVFAAGRPTYWTYLKQKNYVYFQEFIPDALYDLRVIIIGNKYFGYYRKKPKNDFRASGAGLFEKKAIPLEALLLAKKVKEKLETTVLAVDMLKSEKQNEYKIIEISIFIQVDTPEQLKVNGVAGYYEYQKGKFIFKPGKYWIQELALNEVMKKWIRNKINDKI